MVLAQRHNTHTHMGISIQLAQYSLDAMSISKLRENNNGNTDGIHMTRLTHSLTFLSNVLKLMLMKSKCRD